jgi:hypothetical protein
MCRRGLQEGTGWGAKAGASLLTMDSSMRATSAADMEAKLSSPAVPSMDPISRL